MRHVAWLIVTAACLSLAACSQSPSSEPTTPADQGSLEPLREVVLDGLLPTSDGGTFELVGEITGWSVSGEEGDGVVLVLPLAVDGVRSEVEFDVETSEKTRVLTAAGAEVPGSHQDGFLESLAEPFFRAVVRPSESGGLRALELQELPDAGGPQATPTASSSPAAGSQIRLLSGDGVLPMNSEGTLELVGKRVGSSGTDKELEEALFDVPLLIDGVAASMQLAVAVDDKTRMVDESGREVPRRDQERALYKLSRLWRATVQTSGQGELVVLTMRPATGG